MLRHDDQRSCERHPAQIIHHSLSSTTTPAFPLHLHRHADIIALGLGGVGTGPLVLALQLALEVGAAPARWQWLAMFWTCAAVTLLGAFSAISLFSQYGKVR